MGIHRTIGVRCVLALALAMSVAAACGLDLGGDLTLLPPRADAEPPSEASVDAAPPCEASPCVVDVAAGYSVTCVAILGERPRCWGRNERGQLGSGVIDGGANLTPSATPRVVVLTEPATRVSAGGFADGNDERAVACAIGESGDVWCWGDDTYGQRGRADAGPIPGSIPDRVAYVEGASGVSVGGSHVCASLGDGGLRCWGRTHVGQIGRVAPPTSLALDVPTRAPVRAVSAGNFHTCILRVDGLVDCWGYNEQGQLGHLKTNLNPVEPQVATVPTLVGAKVVSAGHAQTCVVGGDAGVSCFGFNGQYQIGRAPLAAATEPGPVPLPRPAVEVCTGYIHSCALLDDGRAACWGDNRLGQLGADRDGGADPQPAPVIVEGVQSAKRITCGGWHTCVLLESGAVTCWGGNQDAQLGRGGDAGGDLQRHPAAAPVLF